MQTDLMKISGMGCNGCSSKVELALKSISGVSEVKVLLSDEEAIVKYNENMTSKDQLKSAVINIGYIVDAIYTEQK